MFKPSAELIRAAMTATSRQHGSTGCVGEYQIACFWQEAGRAADQIRITSPSGAVASVYVTHGSTDVSDTSCPFGWANVPEGAKIVAFEDSWGRWWAPCGPRAAGVQPFGPEQFAHRVSNRQAKRLRAAGHVIDLDGCCEVIVAVPGAVRVMRKSR